MMGWCLISMHREPDRPVALLTLASGWLIQQILNLAVQAVERAGGTILRRGEFCPGEPYVFFTDLDGYEIEISYELPTPVDPSER